MRQQGDKVVFRSIPATNPQDGSSQGSIWIGPGLQYIVMDCFGTESPACVLMSAEDILDAFWPRGRLTQIYKIASESVRIELLEDLVFFTFIPSEERDLAVSAKELRKLCKWAVKKSRKGAKQLRLPIEQFLEQNLR